MLCTSALNSSVAPLAGARATRSVPMTPLAPATFSTIQFSLSSSPSSLL